jgi:hypothetical protein
MLLSARQPGIASPLLGPDCPGLPAPEPESPFGRLREAISAVEYKRELIYFMFLMYEAGHNVDEMRQR